MTYSTPSEDARRMAPAAARNREPILSVLRSVLPKAGRVLEVASGTGEHGVYFAAAFPDLEWQSSDPDVQACTSIEAWRVHSALPNLMPVFRLNAADDVWPVIVAQALVCINMIHISPWEATVGLFKGGSKVLDTGAPLVLYGPYIEEGIETAQSNVAFDQSLKERNPAWGLRNVVDIDRLATDYGFARSRRVEMPANNIMLVYCKR